ncbi:class I SAM-dependent methyltransferase [Actinokineospora diospyrosa]|uniref:Methyltransferase domain-containing protein n=1 Tax=Actinokineospora diospyrosa TaxID=103728 RepID=A0ABT1IAD2_9PSEU|nr:class I SAM-dependent methyltransferase [Actinokineospora diospyrosa]MCP2269523.1 Methyltransferase domain-containing protein [Actinokineospora diospyrosa]
MGQPVNANWQGFWSDLPHERGLAIWDSAPGVTATAQLPLFEQHFAIDLPVLDVGCGNGTQSAALAEHYGRVLGLDFAPAAIEHATALHADSGVDFRTFDLADPAAATALHAELGDTNIYMRGVLHQMPDERRPAAAASLATLLGASGHLFAVELAPAAGDTIKDALSQSPTAVPKMRQVFKHNLTPAAWVDGKLQEVLASAGLSILDSGAIILQGTDTLPNGDRLDLPMTYVIARAG